MNPLSILSGTFGYDSFRTGQSELIDAILKGQDVCGIMPTGAGKSLCFQVPAMLLQGITLVVSPLISLMRDQVLALVANGVPAAFINSSLTDSQIAKAMFNARSGLYKIIYIAPERLLTPSVRALAAYQDISMIAVDEAHCISQWGQDFRPAYLDIVEFLANLPQRPVVGAFTATATPRVCNDIVRILTLRSPLTLTTGFDRPNLFFDVRFPKDKYAALEAYLRENDTSGIVYCSTRKEVDRVTENLIEDGYNAAAYHAGLSAESRIAAQDGFLHDKIKVIVATNAFGMGIDKSNVRFVIHYNMPQNVEAYYQEAGRAGRDGLPADCLLFFARKDINTAVYLITQSDNYEEVRRNRRLLDKMEQYCTTKSCLRNYMLEYFGEKTGNKCENCGNCSSKTSVTGDVHNIQKISRNSMQKYAFSSQLFEKLKALRLEISKQEKMPAFTIFSDATLVDMCQKHPTTPDELLDVSGIGQIKLQRYGERFLDVLRKEEKGEKNKISIMTLTPQLLMQEVFTEDVLLPISRVADNINAILLKYGKAKTSGMALNKLLLENSYLDDTTGTKLPTPLGTTAGIATVHRESSRGAYEQCLFNAKAQRLCISLVKIK